MGQHLFEVSQRVPHAGAFVSGQAAGPAAPGQIQNRRMRASLWFEKRSS